MVAQGCVAGFAKGPDGVFPKKSALYTFTDKEKGWNTGNRPNRSLVQTLLAFTLMYEDSESASNWRPLCSLK